MYMQLLTSNPRSLGCVDKSKYFWRFPSYESEQLDSSPSICLEITRILPSITPLKHYIRNPLDALKEKELKSNKTIVHCFRSLIILEVASLCPLEQFLLFPKFPFLVRLLSRDGRLRWWRPRWRTLFL